MGYDLIGQKIDEYTVLEQVPSVDMFPRRKDARYWLCKCSCGNVAILTSSQLMNKKRPNKMCHSCVVLKKMTGEASPRYTGYKGLPGRRWRQILTHAKSRNLEISVTIEDIWNLFVKQDSKCALTGRQLKFGPNSSSSASLDRIDSKKGYINGNIQWLHKDVQKIKIDLDQTHFISLCSEIAEYNRGLA